MIKVAAGQYTPVCEIQARKNQMKNILEKAATECVDFLCLPEGFLIGYYAQEDLARNNSLEVGGVGFKEWLEVFRNSAYYVIWCQIVAAVWMPLNEDTNVPYLTIFA